MLNLAKSTGQYYVNHRWLGGMLTNWGTISNSIKKLQKIEQDLSSENRGFTKKELLKMSVQRDKLQRSLRWNNGNEKSSRFSFCNRYKL